MKNRSFILAQQKEYHELHRDQSNKASRDWAKRNRDKVKAIQKRCRDKNRAAFLLRERKQREKHWAKASYDRLRRSACGRACATHQELLGLWEKQHGVCGLTGVAIPSNVKPHLDHRIPQSKGGSHTIDNLRWVHPMANFAKRHSSDEEFLAWWNSR